jgi:hypothetical protein
VSNNLDSNVLTTRKCYNILDRRYAAIGFSIDIVKREGMHFTRRKKDKVFSAFLVDERDAQPDQPPTHIAPSNVVRWLGIFYDRTLEWNEHVRRAATKARSTTTEVRLLTNSVNSLSAANARLVFKATILPVLTFGCQVWFTGTRQKGLVNVLQQALLTNQIA